MVTRRAEVTDRVLFVEPLLGMLQRPLPAMPLEVRHVMPLVPIPGVLAKAAECRSAPWQKGEGRGSKPSRGWLSFLVKSMAYMGSLVPS